jgi:hypothetical protein
MSQAFELATRSGSKALMMIAQAAPRFENSWPPCVQQRYMLAGLGFTSPDTRRATGTHWVRAIVDPKDPQVSSFRQEIVKENLVNHGSKSP